MCLAQLNGSDVKNKAEVWTQNWLTDGGGKVETTGQNRIGMTTLEKFSVEEVNVGQSLGWSGIKPASFCFSEEKQTYLATLIALWYPILEPI